VREISAVAPRESVEFLAGLPAQAGAQNLVYQAFGQWMSADSLAASEWLSHQPPGEVRHSATQMLVQSLSGGPNPDFEAAAHWALTLPDAATNGTVFRLFRGWMKRDLESARAFLDRAECPPELRAAVDPLPAATP